MSVAGIISAAAAKKGLEKVLEDIYEGSKGAVRKKLQRWKAQSTIETLYKKIKNVRMVKTILQAEKAVDLLKVYYPSKLVVGKKRQEIRGLDELEYEGNIVVRGTVGQGKSIFFRYLTSSEMVKGKRLPLFVELRRIGRNEKLLAHLVEEARVLGLKAMDNQTFQWLAEHGKVILLLDGFDEVREGDRTRLITEIERIAKKYDKLRILISSRPNSGIENSAFFRVFELAPLDGGEYVNVIRAVAEPDSAESIIKAVGASRTGVAGLLVTPLMVALLVVRYRIEHTIPENVLGFYQGLFGLLLSRHDKMKGGYTRSRRSGLGDSALQSVFEGICFLTRKKMEGPLSRRDVVEFARESARLTAYDCKPDNVVDDIMKVTCLILQEGEECRFIHKSVEEYHSARFIKHQPDVIAQQFYRHAVELKDSIHLGGNWEQELRFLFMIDKYRFLKWFLVPAVFEMLGTRAERWIIESNVAPEVITEVFAGLALRLEVPDNLTWFISGGTRAAWNLVLFPFLLGESLFAGLPDLSYGNVRARFPESKCESIDVVAIPSLLDCALTKWAQQKLKRMYVELAKARKYVEDVEARESVFQF